MKFVAGGNELDIQMDEEIVVLVTIGSGFSFFFFFLSLQVVNKRGVRVSNHNADVLYDTIEKSKFSFFPTVLTPLDLSFIIVDSSEFRSFA